MRLIIYVVYRGQPTISGRVKEGLLPAGRYFVDSGSSEAAKHAVRPVLPADKVIPHVRGEEAPHHEAAHIYAIQ